MRLATSGIPVNIRGNLVGTIALREVALDERDQRIRVFVEGQTPDAKAIEGYLAILAVEKIPPDIRLPAVERLRDFDHFREGDVVAIDSGSGFVRSLYRPAETHHSLFATERCNSHCLMCSQPPKDRDDIPELLARNLRLIPLMKPAPPYLTITGGEPTLLGKDLFTLLRALKEHLPQTEIHMLTNGRTFAWPAFSQDLAAVAHPNFSVGIPLYSDFAQDHDYVVQAKGAFDQTMAGLHQLARNGIRVEIRVVLHKLTITRLTKLAEFIYRNLSFVEHIALMGLEHTGYTPRNIDQLWIDPFDYQDKLHETVEFLEQRDMAVSLYNQQLCVLRPSLWRFAKKSISDWKNVYISECDQCARTGDCGGLFKWTAHKHSERIHPLPA